MSDGKITVRLEGEWTLTIDEVWPDGAPDDVSAFAVVEAIEAMGSIGRWLHEWNLEQDVGVEVECFVANPEFTQAEALFPEHAATPVIHSKAWMPS